MNVDEINSIYKSTYEKGLTRKLRYYSEQGIINHPGKINKQNDYNDADLARLLVVLMLKDAGIPLNTIKSYAESGELFDSSTIDKALGYLNDKKKEIEANISFLGSQKQVMEAFDDDKFLAPFYAGLSFKDLLDGESMEQIIHKSKEFHQDQQNNSQPDANNTDAVFCTKFGAALTLIALNAKKYGSDSERVKALFSHLYCQFIDYSMTKGNNPEDCTEHGFAEFLDDMISEDTEDGFGSSLKNNMGEERYRLLKKGLAHYKISTSD